AEDGIRGLTVTGVQTCALPIWSGADRRLGRLPPPRARDPAARPRAPAGAAPRRPPNATGRAASVAGPTPPRATRPGAQGTFDERSEERRVGKERRCRR